MQPNQQTLTSVYIDIHNIWSGRGHLLVPSPCCLLHSLLMKIKDLFIQVSFWDGETVCFQKCLNHGFEPEPQKGRAELKKNIYTLVGFIDVKC